MWVLLLLPFIGLLWVPWTVAHAKGHVTAADVVLDT